jgi:hypothetical protein
VRGKRILVYAALIRIGRFGFAAKQLFSPGDILPAQYDGGWSC